MGYPINIKNFCIAEYIDTAGVITYGTPVKIPELMNIDLDMPTEMAKLSGDGKTVATASSEGDITFKCGVTKVSLPTQALMLGRTFDPITGTLLTNDNDKAPYYAAGFETENDDNTSVFTWLYKGSFKQWSEKLEQIEDGKVKYSTVTGIEATFIPDEEGNKKIVMDESEGSAPPANFLAAVYKPV